MAKVSAKGAVIALKDAAAAAQTISGDVESYTVENAVDANEVTGMGEAVHNFVPGMKVQSITLNVFWNTAATTGAFTVINSIYGQVTNTVLTIQPEGSGKTFTFNCMLQSFVPAGTTKDAIKMGAAKFVAMGATAGSWA